MIQKVSIIILFTVFLYTFISPNVLAGELQKDLVQAESRYSSCIHSLPTQVRLSIGSQTRSEKRHLSGSLKKKVSHCIELRQELDDVKAIIDLSRELIALNSSNSEKNGIKHEAEILADVLVKSTKRLKKKYKMGNVALWHNFLIKIGAKEGGYCYQWAEELFKSMPQKKMTYFERHWGVHNRAQVTENNAVILTIRGEDLSRGIVYDPWRGKGKPFWKVVSSDRQSWSRLFTEDQILIGGY